MSKGTEREIQAARDAVVEATQKTVFPVGSSIHIALEALEALESPLPTRYELAERIREVTDMFGGGSYTRIACQLRADALRNVAKQLRDSKQHTTVRESAGGPDLLGYELGVAARVAAKEFERQADELEVRS